MGTQFDNVKSKIMEIFHDENAVSEIIGEVLLTAIAVLAFSVIAVFVFSYLQSEDAVHADVDGWVDVSSDTVYLRHSGGENIDLNKVELVLNLNGTRRDLSSSQLKQILGSSSWHLGQTIIIDTDVLWNTSINEDDYVGMILLQTDSNLVIESGSLLGEELDMSSGSGSSGNVTPSQYAPVADFTYSPSYPGTLQTVVFTDQSSDSDGTVVVWSWNFGDGGTSSSQDTSHSYSSAGTYTITLTVTDNDGNTDSTSQSITVVAPSGIFANDITLNTPSKGGVIKDGGYISFTNDGNYRYVEIDGTRYNLNQNDEIKLEVVNDQISGIISMNISSSQISTFDLNANLYINGVLQDTGQVTDIYVQPISNYYSTLKYELPSDSSQTYLKADSDVIINWEINDSAINISNIGFYSSGSTQLNFDSSSTYITCSGYYELSSPEQPVTPETTSLVSLWNFDIRSDNIVADSAGENDGTIVGASRVSSGVNNSAIQFQQGPGAGSGNKEYITVPHSSNLDMTTEGSVEAWVYLEEYSDFSGIVHKGQSTDFSDESYSLQFGGGAFGNDHQILFSLNNGEYLVLSSTQLSLLTWYHVVGTWNSTSINVYIDGIMDNTNSDTNIAANPSTGSLQMGAQLPGGTYGFNGMMDEVAVYNYALNATEVQQRYDLYA